MLGVTKFLSYRRRGILVVGLVILPLNVIGVTDVAALDLQEISQSHHQQRQNPAVSFIRSEHLGLYRKQELRLKLPVVSRHKIVSGADSNQVYDFVKPMPQPETPVELIKTEFSHDCSIDSCIALTFDDGPDPELTPKILSVLRARDVSATFFVQGMQVKRYPELTQEIARDGHEIENHTYDHTDLVKLHDPALIRSQINDTQSELAALGIQSKFLRPPYGFIDDHVRSIADMPIIMWNIDSKEWRSSMTTETMVATIIEQAKPGAIVLMHDTKPITLSALPHIIDQLHDRNFRFVTVEKLLQIDGSARGDFASK